MIYKLGNKNKFCYFNVGVIRVLTAAPTAGATVSWCWGITVLSFCIVIWDCVHLYQCQFKIFINTKKVKKPTLHLIIISSKDLIYHKAEYRKENPQKTKKTQIRNSKICQIAKKEQELGINTVGSV